MQSSLAQTRTEIEFTRVIIVTVGISGRSLPKWEEFAGSKGAACGFTQTRKQLVDG